MRQRKLTEAEKYVIVDGGQEMPFTGEYDQKFDKGVYVCRRCGAHLYKSETKFDAHCGWPGFDKPIRGAVKTVPDPDGERTQVMCAKCGAHLGHVFIGEGFTKTNTRYCMSSIAMRFISKGKRFTEDVKREKHAEVVHHGMIVDADNSEEKY